MTLAEVKAVFTLFALSILTGCADVVDETKGVSDVCPVHHQRMEKRKVGIAYGYQPVGAILEYERVKPLRFPFGETIAAASCEAPAAGPHFVRLYICRDCVVAAELWQKAKQANKAPEPTPGSVTPRATEGDSK